MQGLAAAVKTGVYKERENDQFALCHHNGPASQIHLTILSFPHCCRENKQHQIMKS